MEYFIENKFKDRFLPALAPDILYKKSATDVYNDYIGDNLYLDDTLYIFAGSDSGLLCSFIESLTLPTTSYYIIIECEEYIEVISDNMTSLSQCELINIEIADEYLRKEEFETYFSTSRIKAIKSLVVSYGKSEIYLELYWRLQSICHNISWIKKDLSAQDIFIKRILENAPDELLSVEELKGKYTGKNVAILAGGPSLDDHIEWISNNKNNIYIMAVSRIAHKLRSIGLTPDFIISVDPNKMNYLQSREVFAFDVTQDCKFIYANHVIPDLPAQWLGEKYYVGEILPWESSLCRGEVISVSGPTVSNSAVDLCGYFGFKKIILLGVDLCFTKDGKTHEKHSKERKSGLRSDIPDLFVENNDGEKVRTTPDFLFARNILENQAERILRGGGEVLTFSSVATQMKNIKFLKSYPVLSKCEKVKIRANFRCVDRYREFLLNLKSELSVIKNSIDIALDKIDSLAGTEEKLIDFFVQSFECERIDSMQIIKLAKRIALDSLVVASAINKELESLTESEVYDRISEIDSAVIEGVRKLSLYIEKSLNKTFGRLSELECIENRKISGEYFDYLISSGELRRVELFKEILSYDDSKYSELIAAFDEVSNTDYMEAVSRLVLVKNLDGLASLLDKLTNNKDLKSIEDLKNEYSGFNEARPYLPLIDAALSMLKGDFDRVYVILEPVVASASSPILEHALVYISRAAMNRGDNQILLDALAGLAICNSRYMYSYAKALYAAGQIKDAIVHMQEYLVKFPDDRRASLWLKNQNN